MSYFRYDSASAFADQYPKALEVRLSRLEIHAFQQHPEIYRWFGADGAATARAQRKPSSFLKRAGTAIAITALLIGFASPVFGLAGFSAIGGNRFGFNPLRPEIAFPLGGVAYAVTAVTQIVTLVVWLVLRARWSGFLAGVTVATLVLSALGVVNLSNLSAEYPEAQSWLPVVNTATLASLVLLIAVLVRFRSRKPAVDPSLSLPQEGVDGPSAAEEIAALPADERAAILEDRQRALTILHDAGHIDDATLERALAAELGTLHLLDPVPKVGLRS